MLAGVLSRSVSARTRAKGLDYFRSGRVVLLEGAEWMVHAVVRGAHDYRVRISRDSDGFMSSCDCPYYRDRDEICKHIWAALLAAENRGLLAGDGSAPPAFIDIDYDTVDSDAPDPPDSFHLRGAPGAHRSVVRAASPPPWERFLAELQQNLAAQEQAVPQPRFAHGELVYVLDAAATLQGHGIALNIQFRQRKKNGEWSKSKPAPMTAQEVDHLPDAEDREILSLLMGAGDMWMGPGTGYYGGAYQTRATYRLNASMASRVLPIIGRTGRVHLLAASGDPNPIPVAWDDGPAWRFELNIASAPESDGVRIDGALVREGERMSVGDPVLVLRNGFLLTRSTLARLDASSGFAWLAQLRRTGPFDVPRNATAPLLETLARSGVSPDALPEEFRYEIFTATPRPCVTVTRPVHASYGARDLLDATVRFDYDGIMVPAQPGTATFDQARRRLLRRDRPAEQLALQRLSQLGFVNTWNYAEGRQGVGVGVEQFPRAVRTLVAEGWRVEAEGRVFRSPHAMHVHVASGVDWFELHGRVDYGDGVSATLPALLAALQRGDGTVTLDDGTKGLVPEDWLRRYAGVARFGESTGDHVRFRPSQTTLLDALLETQPAVSVDEAFAQARAALKTFDGIAPLDPPASFAGTLREYQREALGWLDFLRRFGFGGCLADDMGLGKTVMVLAMLEARRRARGRGKRQPSLAVVPRSLVFNWMDEAQRFTPGLRVLDYTGAERTAARLDAHDLVLTTYGTMRRDVTRLKDLEFDYVVLDEAQAIKNASTAAAKAVRLLRARHRLALSGTPIENHVGELWSLFEFLNPGLLGSFAGFQTATAGRARNDRDGLGLLAKAVRPFILRRTKQQVAPELPERSEQTIHCELEGAQRRLYDQLRAHYRTTLLKRVERDGLNRSKIHVLEALLRLRQAACHPALIDQERAGDPCAKLDVLLPQLLEVTEEGHKALVFSQFTSFLALLRRRLDQQGIVYEYLDGQTRDRAARIARFQSDRACQLFLISLKAGGLGLNLTEAEYVFLLDPWWNPAVEAQAIDRAHRIGQSRHVFAYRLIAKDTVEEKVADLQQSKRELAEAILSADAGLLRDLKAEDLDWLLS